MKKRILVLALVVILALGMATPALGSSAITVFVDGSRLYLDSNPITSGGRTLVPMRGIFEALGYTVVWSPGPQRITATRPGSEIIMTIGSTRATVNGFQFTLEVAPRTQNNRTFVPLRFVGEASGSAVNWNAGTRTININTSGTSIITPPATTSIVGRWQIESGVFIYYFFEASSIEFFADGRVIEYQYDEPGRWALSGNTLTIYGEWTGTHVFTINLQGNRLTITDMDGDSRTYRRVS